MQSCCYWCGEDFEFGKPPVLVNVAPDAAGGAGIFMPHHERCAPTKILVVPNETRPARRIMMKES